MKRLLLFLSTLIIAALLATSISNAQINPKSLIDYLKAGNADKLSAYFASSLEIGIGDEEDTYNKEEAANILRTFFANHKPGSFSIKHKGNAPDGSEFIIGHLQTNKGNFRTYLVIKNNTIQELSFED